MKVIEFHSPTRSATRIVRRSEDFLKQHLVDEKDKREWAAEKFADGIRMFGAVYGEQELISQLQTTLEVVQRLALRGPRADA